MRSHSAHCSSRSWESGSLHGLRCRAACAARMRAATHRWVDLGVEAGANTAQSAYYMLLVRANVTSADIARLDWAVHCYMHSNHLHARF